jgi:DNA-3-methyladenine glycosylase II
MLSFNKSNYNNYVLDLAAKHKELQSIVANYGLPPFWQRSQTLDSVVKTILEQQVSLASATAVYNKLKNYCKIIDAPTMHAITLDELGKCGITRQKQQYIKAATSLEINKPGYFKIINKLKDHELETELIKIKGIGKWSAAVMMLVMYNRLNVYPPNDVALLKGIQMGLALNQPVNNTQALELIEKYSPYKSIAVCLFYWEYINVKGVVFTP